MSAPRVALVLNTMGLGGVPVVAWELARRRAPGTRIVVYALRDARDHAEARDRWRGRFAEAGIEVRLPRHDDKMRVVGELAEWMEADGVDIVHTHSYKPNIYGRLAARLVPRVATVAHYHNVYADRWEREGTLAHERLLAPLTGRLVACTEAVAADVASALDLDRSVIDVVPNGVDVDRYAAGGDGERLRRQLGIPADVPVVGTVGRICEQKAQDRFLEAAAAIGRRLPHAAFIVAGAAEEPERLAALRDQAGRLGIDDRVHFTGHVADTAALYSALDIMALPSRWEGFGLVVAEAMAAGVPVVASDLPPIREVVGDDGAAVLIPPADAARLGSAVLDLLDDPARADDLGRRGAVRARDLDWATSARMLDAVYDELMEARCPA